MDMDYRKAGWINNQSAKATYTQIYHLRRLMSYASKSGDRRLQSVAARMIQSYMINETVIAFAALETHLNKAVR